MPPVLTYRVIDKSCITNGEIKVVVFKFFSASDVVLLGHVKQHVQ